MMKVNKEGQSKGKREAVRSSIGGEIMRKLQLFPYSYIFILLQSVHMIN